MTIVLLLGGLVTAAAFIATAFWVSLARPEILRRLGAQAVKLVHGRAEYARISGGERGLLKRAPSSGKKDEAGKEPSNGQGAGPWTTRWARQAITPLGIWGILASSVFLVFWAGDWVSPSLPQGYLSHLVGSILWGLLMPSITIGGVKSVLAFVTIGRIRLFATRTGLERVWIQRPVLERGAFEGRLTEAIAASHRVEILDFTGQELLVRGSPEDGGPLAVALQGAKDKEVRILLYNPSASVTDPDRKHTTVIQSQLGAMGMSREAFESRLQATIERIDHLNRERQRPIEVRLYCEKPAFRILVAGESCFFGAIDGRDTAGEIPIYEASSRSEGPSLHNALRGHFLRVWGDSVPATIEAHVEEEPAEQANA